jgi:hypothetical protein
MCPPSRTTGHSRLSLNGDEVLWNPVNRRVKTRESEAPAEPRNAGARCGRLPAFLRSSRDRCSAREGDAAQQELRPPGTDSCQKFNAIRLAPNGVEVLWNPWTRRVKIWDGEAPAEPRNAGARCGRLPALRSSRGRCSARGGGAAQQELRPPGTASCRQVKARRHPPAVPPPAP